MAPNEPMNERAVDLIAEERMLLRIEDLEEKLEAHRAAMATWRALLLALEKDREEKTQTAWNELMNHCGEATKKLAELEAL